MTSKFIRFQNKAQQNNNTQKLNITANIRIQTNHFIHRSLSLSWSLSIVAINHTQKDWIQFLYTCYLSVSSDDEFWWLRYS